MSATETIIAGSVSGALDLTEAAAQYDRGLELSVVMPCLNEADTLEICVRKAQEALRENHINGEIVVADNGSTDGSREIAERLGARVICVMQPGYGSALMGGIEAARGRYIIMGDADDSYDFREIPKFLEKLRAGYDLVQGCRFKSGGGQIMPGAMPPSHYWFGNPLFSFLVRKWFHSSIHDVYCGLRGFSKKLFQRLDQRCRGMEFATEMIIKASLLGEKIAEVPITLHRDGRKSHAPHLKTVRDGWRTLRFFLMCSPRWLFLIPGAALILFGLLGYSIALPGLTVRGITFDAHTLLFASLFLLCGYQSILFAIFAKTFAITEGLLPADGQLKRFYELVNLEKGLIASVVAILVGGALLIAAINQWRTAAFGHLDYAVTMRLVVPGASLIALGFQTVLSSFFISILGMGRK
jgi:glycosyltransferase involved in cell wall biosynthesis